MSKKILLLLCVLYTVSAIPVPEEKLKSIELIKIPLKGDKELDVLTLGDEGSLKERNKRTIGVLRELFPELSKAIAIENDQSQGDDKDGAASQIDLIRVVRETAAKENSIDSETSDQKTAESKSPAIDDLSLDSEENDEKSHDKRFLDFNGGSGSSSGGSGNFLFDIIRRTADRSARFAGRVYRVVAGTESLDDNLPSTDQDTFNNDKTARTSRTNSNGDLSLLVSGSSGTEKTDEEENAPEDEEHEEGKGDGYTEGIPGPVTRLFVLANRGLSNLIQDLILRIAQTSERLVNFKARLITSLI